MDCPIEGIPNPNKTWIHVDSSQHISYSDTLNIDELSDSSQGLYLCNGSNHFGSVSYAYELKLAGILLDF